MAPNPLSLLPPEQLVHVLFHYQPSIAAAWVFLALFLAAAIWNLALTVRYKTPFMAWVGITGLLEVGLPGCRPSLCSRPAAQLANSSPGSCRVAC